MTRTYQTTTKTLKLISILMMSVNLWASTYCFERSESLFKIKKDLKNIMLNDEDVVIDTKSNCIETAVRPYREGLVSKYLRLNYNIKPELSRKSQISGQLCRFHIKKSELIEKKTNEVNVGKNNRLSSTATDEKILSSREIIVSEGRVGLLTVDDENIYVKCEKYSSNYGVELSLSSDFSQSITTSVTMVKGEWINISTIKDDLSRKSNTKSLSHGIDYRKQTGEKTINYFVSIK